MRRLTRNEYGIHLDCNGYAPTIMEHKPLKCFKCERYRETVRHEIFGGALRSKSKQYGLWVNVCPACHAEIHGSGQLQAEYHALAQRIAMQHYGWAVQDFRRRFYKSYIEQE